MALTTEQIVKLHQLKSVGRKTLFSIYEFSEDKFFDDDKELMNFVKDISVNKKLKKIPNYEDLDIITAFKKGQIGRAHV